MPGLILNPVILIYSRTSFSFNHETDDRHTCGKPQGGEPACLMDDSAYIARYKVGDNFGGFVAAPGTGERVYRITKINARGIWGVLIKDTVRELTIEEVK